MKRVFLIMFLLCMAFVYAGVEEPFVQVPESAYCSPHVMRTEQNWIPAQLITLNVNAGFDYWLSNYVNSFFVGRVPDLHGNQFDMLGNQKYGYIFADDLLNFNMTDYLDKIHWSDGSKTTEITYFYDEDPSIKINAKGYFLDHFDKDSEIYLVMTTLPDDGGETVDSYQYVYDLDHATTLVSRLHNTVDLAGNVRVNFGINSESEGYIGREFVAVAETPETIHLGSPLPGVMSSCMIMAGIVGLAKMKKKEK